MKQPKKKKSVVVSMIKALSEKSADQFSKDISTGELYKQLAPGEKKNEKK